MSDAQQNLGIVRQYLQALERFASGDELARFFSPDVVQQEFPNRLTPQGARRGLADLLAGAERGGQLLARQSYQVRHAVAQHDVVALEIEWSGALAVSPGSSTAGKELRANIAVFFELADGRIKAQRNYDCHEA